MGKEGLGTEEGGKERKIEDWERKKEGKKDKMREKRGKETKEELEEIELRI